MVKHGLIRLKWADYHIYHCKYPVSRMSHMNLTILLKIARLGIRFDKILRAIRSYGRSK